MSLTVSQLEYFIATLDGGSFTAAADALGVTQPAVAEQIRRLERAVGQSLFARRARGVRPTGAGIELEEHARRIVDAVATAMTVMSAANSVETGTIAFGTIGSMHHYRIEDLIREFAAEHPGSRLRIEAHNSSSTAERVRSGTLDAGIVALPIDDSGLDIEPIAFGEVFYITSDPVRAQTPVSITDAASRTLILYESSSRLSDPTRMQLMARAQAAGVDLSGHFEVESADTALQLAAGGLGDSYAPQILVGRLDQRLHPVSFDPPLVDTFALIRRRGSRLSRPVNDFVERITSHMKSGIAQSVAARR